MTECCKVENAIPLLRRIEDANKLPAGNCCQSWQSFRSAHTPAGNKRSKYPMMPYSVETLNVTNSVLHITIQSLCTIVDLYPGTATFGTLTLLSLLG